MKKLCLVVFSVIAGLSVSSCSDENGEVLHKSGGDLTMIVNGVEKSYNNVRVSENAEPDGDIMLTVTASSNGDSGEYITFRVYKLLTGDDKAIRWIYSEDSNLAKRRTVDGVEYDISSNLMFNNNERLRGTFSGKLYNVYSQRSVKIEEGRFNYEYEIQPQQ